MTANCEIIVDVPERNRISIFGVMGYTGKTYGQLSNLSTYFDENKFQF